MASSSDGPVVQPRVVYVRPAPSNPLKVDKLALRYLVLGLLLTVTCKLSMDYYINNHMVATTDGRDAQLRERMEHTLQALLAPGKGILAADESLPTMNRRFEQVGLPANDSNVRAAWRRVILTTPGLEDYVSGVILTEETLRQTQGAGLDPLASFLRTDSSGNAGHKGNGAGGGGASIGQHGSAEAHGGSAKAEGGGVGGSEGLVPPPSWTKWPLPFNLTSRKIRVGVKVDLGTRPFSPDSGAAPGELYTEGLEGLEARCWQYVQLAASFTKWRAVFHMNPVAADLGQGSRTQTSGQGSDEGPNVVVGHDKDASGDEQSSTAVNREADGVADGQGMGEQKGDREREGNGADERLGWDVDAIVEEAEDDPSTWDWGGEWRRHEAIHAAAQRRGELLQMQRRLTRHMSPQQLQQLQQQVLQQQQQEQQGLRRRRPRPSSAAGAAGGAALLLQRPSLAALRHNAADLAEFAAASQRAGIVPIVEPELLLQLPASSCSCTHPPPPTPEPSSSEGAPAHLDEGEAFAAAAAATRRVLRAVAAALAAHPSVKTDLVIIKPNMVLQPSPACPPCPSHPSSHASSTESASEVTHQPSDELSPEAHGETGFPARPESDAKQPGVKDALTLSSVAATTAMADRVAVATVEALKELRTLLPSLPGVAFLSGGQSPEEAARNLHAISLLVSQTAWAQPATEQQQQQQQPEREQQREAGPLAVTFSFGRALLQQPLELWAAGLRAEAEAATKAASELESPAHQGEAHVEESGDEDTAGGVKGTVEMDSKGEVRLEGKGEVGEEEGEGEGKIGGGECSAAGDATEEGWCLASQGAQRTALQQQQQLQMQQQQQQQQQQADRQERMRQLEQRAQAELLRWCEANSRAVQGQDPLA